MRQFEKPLMLEIASSLMHDRNLSAKEVQQDLQTLHRRVAHEGISFFTKTLPKLGKSLYASLGAQTLSWDRSAFKARRLCRVPEFLRSHWLRVFDSNGALLPEPCTDTIRFLSTFCFLFYKLEMEVDYDVEALTAGFIANDDLVVDDIEPWLKNLIRSDFHKWFDGFSLEDLKPAHGPGVSSNLESKNAKYSAYPRFSRAIEHFKPTFFNHHAEILPRFTRTVSTTLRALICAFVVGGDGPGDYWSWTGTRFERYAELAMHPRIRECRPRVSAYKPTARMLFVPKDSRGPRIISCEPWEHMYAQQSLKRFVCDRLERGSDTAGRVNFTDQTVNQRLVLQHSATQAYSTLDLKDASDMVPYGVVKDLFPSEMWAAIDACRSEWTLSPDGSQHIKLKKFAPMGSALCFPVMAAYLYSGMTHYIAKKLGVMRRCLLDIYVYGDDIVVPTEYAQLAVEAIEALGLKVNKDKSFIGSRFLESCGFDCFGGVLVTPFRIKKLVGEAKRQNPRVLSNPEGLLNLCSVANRAASVFPKFADRLYQIVERTTGPLPFGVLNSPFLCRVVDSAEEAWYQNHLKAGWDAYDGKVWAWSVKVCPTHYEETDYGKLRRSLSLAGTERKAHDFVENEFPNGKVLLIKKNHQEWWSSAYA